MTIERRIRGLLCPHRFFLWVLMVSLLTGCATGSFNSDPACRDCKKFLGESSPPEILPPVCDKETPTVETSKQFTNLVFEGGGVKGAAYIGALEVMGKADLLASVQRVAGTSAGAITAAMVALGLSPEDIRTLMIDLDFKKFTDGSCFLGNTSRLLKRYGWYKGDFFLCFMECLVERRLQRRDATFEDLQARINNPKPGDPPFRELFVIGTDVTTNNTHLFSAATTPKTRIADAVRISMSIPLFFAAREAEVRDGSGDQRDIFVDGGVLRNYAIDLFDGHKVYGRADYPVNEATLGFHLGTLSRERHGTGDLIEFSSQVVNTLLNSQVVSLCNGSRTRDVERSVFIDTLGISTIDFGITTTQKCELANSGAAATAQYLDSSTPQQSCPNWMMETLRKETAGWYVD